MFLKGQKRMKVCIIKAFLAIEFLTYYNSENDAPPEGNLFLDTIDLVGRLSRGKLIQQRCNI